MIATNKLNDGIIVKTNPLRKNIGEGVLEGVEAVKSQPVNYIPFWEWSEKVLRLESIVERRRAIEESPEYKELFREKMFKRIEKITEEFRLKGCLPDNKLEELEREAKENIFNNPAIDKVTKDLEDLIFALCIGGM